MKGHGEGGRLRPPVEKLVGGVDETVAVCGMAKVCESPRAALS